MANLSQQKRQRMLEFIDKIKEEHKDDDEMLIALGEIENELNSKKYGLVWEQHEEAVDVMMKDNIPVFTECLDKEIVSDDSGNFNFLLEGDNLHSLKLLEKTHAGKVDVIYIDPPYNTGKKDDFVYDDNYIVKEDGYRHSKWLSFMQERLLVASSLLTSSGIILISIDDNEYANLKILCDEIFGETRYVTTLIWQKKTGASDAKGIATITEYILVYCVNNFFENSFSKNTQSYDLKRYRYKDEFIDSRGPYYIDNLDRGGLSYSDSLNYGIECPDGTITYPNGRTEYLNDGWIWKWGKEKIQWALENEFVEFRKTNKKKSGWAVCYKNYLNVNNENKPIERSAPHKNLIVDVLNANATANIKEIFGGSSVFKYSKPVELIKKIISYSNKKDALVLDFFAGSGTTGHAVLKLNQEDGGNRKFILCTNNENNICEEITYERIKRVINGYGDVEGIPANLKYYRTDFVSKDSEDVSDELLKHIKEMIQLEHGIQVDGSKYLILLTDEDADELELKWNEYSGIKALYVSRNVLFTSKQNALFANVNIHIIPDDYFKFELQEVGEAW